jgi:uncharacterized cofD-like protein
LPEPVAASGSAGGNGLIRGQYAIETARLPAQPDLRLEPEVFANPKAVEAIESADLVVIGPGNVYCSIVPNLLVKGVPEAIRRSKAKVAYNCNLMTKAGHTDGFSVTDFMAAIERYIGRGRIDFVTYNDHVPEQELLARYAQDGEYPVQPSHDARDSAQAFAADLVSRKIPVIQAADRCRRTLIRHDPDVLAALIVQNCLGGL